MNASCRSPASTRSRRLSSWAASAGRPTNATVSSPVSRVGAGAAGAGARWVEGDPARHPAERAVKSAEQPAAEVLGRVPAEGVAHEPVVHAPYPLAPLVVESLERDAGEQQRYGPRPHPE